MNYYKKNLIFTIKIMKIDEDVVTDFGVFISGS